jgi:hypothetical protein
MESPDDPQEFPQVFNNLKAIVACEGDPGTDVFGVPLTAIEHGYVTECLKRAEAYFAEQQREAAWYFLGLVKEAIGYRNGVLTGRYLSSDQAGATRVAAAHGRKGAAIRAANKREARAKIVEAILAQHRKQPFQIQRQMREAALRLAPGKGEEERDHAWVSSLLRDPALKDFYKTLSRRRRL